MEIYARTPEGYWKKQLRTVGVFCLMAYSILALLCWMEESPTVWPWVVVGALFPFLFLEPADGTRGWYIYKLAYPWLFLGLCLVSALMNPTDLVERWNDHPRWAILCLVVFPTALIWMEVDVIRNWLRRRRAYLGTGHIPNILESTDPPSDAELAQMLQEAQGGPLYDLDDVARDLGLNEGPHTPTEEIPMYTVTDILVGHRISIKIRGTWCSPLDVLTVTPRIRPGESRISFGFRDVDSGSAIQMSLNSDNVVKRVSTEGE